jgi:long-chain acyl-CoA synthetase
MKLSPTEIFRGKNIFFIGGTGFVGKVTLSMLLHNFPDVGKVYVVVRARDQQETLARFWNTIVPSPTFDPLREQHGDKFEDFIKEKVVPVNGDVGDDNLGIPEDEADAIAGKLDIVINSAGNVTFNPPLEHALRTNVVGTNNVLAFTKKMKRPCLIHVSTCFVAGKRSGAVWENEPVVGYFPRHEEMPGVKFSVDQEVEDCANISARAREEAKDAMQNAKFRELARERLAEEGRDPDDEDAISLAIARERKMWVRERTTELGSERAGYWGWTNIYTYTKSLGEQIVAKEDGIIKAIVRPSIVESSHSYPFPGWNEGFTTTAPLILIALKGQSQIPVNEKLVLDITPVDLVAGTMLAIAAEAMTATPKLVYQSCTGDSNPNDMKRIVELVGLYKRTHFKDKETGNKILNQLVARTENKARTQEAYEKYSAPMANKLAKRASGLLDKFNPKWGGGRLGNIVDGLKKNVEGVERSTQETMDAFSLFKPFMIDNAYIFRADNVRELMSRVKTSEQKLTPWQPEKLDWYDYWLNVHFPGLRKWVLPTLEEELRLQPKRAYTYRDLIDLFDTTTKRFGTRVAMRIERDGKKEQYTFQDVQELANRAATFFVRHKIEHGSRVILFSHNMPEWGMTYFGIIKAGATAVPVDPASTVDDIVSFVRAGEVSAIVISDKLRDENPEIEDRLREEKLDCKIWVFDDVFEMLSEAEEAKLAEELPAKAAPNTVASLIFTSGTTGNPKAVMLTHRNFTNMTSMLGSIFEMGLNDGVLSVLPLHHTFEFSTGFLTPFSNGTQITYLEELSGEELSRAIKNGHVTGMVGVPALWEMLHRRIKTRLRDNGSWVAEIADNLIEFNAWLRDKTFLNLGQVMFFPIHEGMGGRIRYLISGGSALSEKVQRDLHGLGFTILEGYGLTEASPVLTVTRPQNKMLGGSVGQPLPGVQIQIAEPDENGVGEVMARGQNIMLGYYNNEEATKEVLEDRWLSTGDLGRLDENGNLYIVGRSKDVIIDSNGKNVYPDEVEELYGKSPYIKELSVVGLPDEGGGEKIVCLVVPDFEKDISLSRAQVNKKVEEHFREVSSGLPFYKRVKSLHLTNFELPRTATRKVKRRDVIEMIIALEERGKKDEREKTEEKTDTTANWLRRIVADVATRPLADVTLGSKLDELGFDSLMFVELAAAIEDGGGKILSPETLNEVQTVRELLTAVERVDKRKELKEAPKEEEKPKEDELHVPSIVRTVGTNIIGFAQKSLYGGILKTTVEGQTNIPPHTNFIVAANHASHLDMGLVKYALGKEVAEQTVAVAAADYWFDTKYKRAYMNNFTTLVPIERSGSLRQSLRHVSQILDEGYNALIFPEGGRQLSGEIAEFKPVIGYLALTNKIGILPICLVGTYEAFPKGTVIPKSKSIGAKVGAKIGRYLEHAELEEMTRGTPKTEAYRLIAARVEHEVRNLRDGTNTKFDVKAMRQKWQSERRKARKQEPIIDE